MVIQYPDSKVHGANMGSTWGRQDPGRPHVGPMNLAIWLVGSYNLVPILIEILIQITLIKRFNATENNRKHERDIT